MADTVAVRRGGDRARTRTAWLDSAHSFSFGAHYDAANTHFGSLLAHNEDRLVAGSGFDEHPHAGVEIVSWVLAGTLVHTDSAGHAGVVTPGRVQRMSAGSGVLHTERNGGPGDLHLVQMWLRSGNDGTPSYDDADVSADLAGGALAPVAALPDATLWVARVPAGHNVSLPVSPYVHLFVAVGGAELEGAGALVAGDAARVTGSEGRRVTAGVAGAEVLAWDMQPLADRISL